VGGCRQTVRFKSGTPPEEKEFVYITDVRQGKDNVLETADTGRMRWKIENEGFNSQKNGGYKLSHLYSRVSYTAMKNYYQLLQIAHSINQFVEKFAELIELLAEHSKQRLFALWKEAICFIICPPIIGHEAEKTDHG